MTKTEITEVSIKACRRPKFKAGAELSGKVNRIEINIDHNMNTVADMECVDVDFKWETEAKLPDCGVE